MNAHNGSRPRSHDRGYFGNDGFPNAAHWLGFFLQSNDTFYPTGSYAHSFGLEGLVQAGLIVDRASLREFVFASAIPSLQHNELPIASLAWHAFAAEDWA